MFSSDKKLYSTCIADEIWLAVFINSLFQLPTAQNTWQKWHVLTPIPTLTFHTRTRWPKSWPNHLLTYLYKRVRFRALYLKNASDMHKRLISDTHFASFFQWFAFQSIKPSQKGTFYAPSRHTTATARRVCDTWRFSFVRSPIAHLVLLAR